MNILKHQLLYFLLLTGPVLGADSTVVPPPPPPDPVGEALPVLEAQYADFKALNFKPGDRLSDLMARSGGKISLVAPDTDMAPVPILTAMLPDGVLYWRLASFALPAAKTWPDLVSQLKQNGVRGVVLDLRSTATPDDYAGATQVRSFFGPSDVINAPRPDVTLGQEPVTQLFAYPTIVLTNNQTSGAAEALAGFLQADGALVVGRPTAGRVALFQQHQLTSGQILRYAVPATPSNDPTLQFKFRSEIPSWGHPVMPDINVNVDDRNERAALVLIKDNHIDDVIQESAHRHRLSEASLVQGQDPEWDDYLASLEQRPVLLSLPVIHDVTLVRALDCLKAIHLSERTVPTQATANAALPASTSIQ